MARYIWDTEARQLVEIVAAPRGPSLFPQVVRDTPAYVSPMSGREVDGRAARREDMKRHDVREVDPSERLKSRPKEPGWVKDWRADRGIVRTAPE